MILNETELPEEPVAPITGSGPLPTPAERRRHCLRTIANRLRAENASARKVIERVAELKPFLSHSGYQIAASMRVEYAADWLAEHPESEA